MKIKLTWEEIKLVADVVRAIPNISSEMARAVSICYADLAPYTPVKAVFKIANEQGIKRTSIAATRSALRGPERDEGFGVLSIGIADAVVVATALKGHCSSGPIPDTVVALLSRLERSLVGAVVEQKKGRGRPRKCEEAAPKVTFDAPEPAATEVPAILIQPVWPPLPPGLNMGWLVSESALVEAYQILRRPKL